MTKFQTTAKMRKFLRCYENFQNSKCDGKCSECRTYVKETLPELLTAAYDHIDEAHKDLRVSIVKIVECCDKDTIKYCAEQMHSRCENCELLDDKYTAFKMKLLEDVFKVLDGRM